VVLGDRLGAETPRPKPVVRQYLPREALNGLSKHDLDEVAAKLNSRPRSLGCDTPAMDSQLLLR